MKEIFITFDRKKFPLPYSTLKDLAHNTDSAEIKDALLAMNIPSIAEILVLQDGLDVDETDPLWDKNDPKLRRTLVSNRYFVEYLTDKQAKDILASKDRELFYWLAANMDQLYSSYLDKEDEEVETGGDKGRNTKEIEDDDRRLSENMRERLLEMLLSYPDPEIRETLALNKGLPHSVLARVQQDPDCYIARTAFKTHILKNIPVAEDDASYEDDD